jgi:glycerophosphoryl diester phosphodiesterase
MKTTTISIILLFLVKATFAQNKPAQKLNQLFDPTNKTILISAHRGDWRNAPENSIQSLKNAIIMGVDIVELDLKKSKDSVIIIMHDATINRTTTGKGKPEDYTWAELQEFYLLAGTGAKTRHKIPSFEEFLETANGKVILCVDKGIDYFDQAMDLINKKNMSNQIIYLIPHMSLDSLKNMKLKNLSNNIALNVVAKPAKTDVKEMVSSYKERKRTIIHPTFDNDTIEFVKWMPNINNMGLHLWLNSLWPEHNGGHDDDRATEINEPDQSWGWLIDNGVNIIQTDRPLLLLEYLRSKGLHN